jgi:hypothetical protein
MSRALAVAMRCINPWVVELSFSGSSFSTSCELSQNAARVSQEAGSEVAEAATSFIVFIFCYLQNLRILGSIHPKRCSEHL